jgi:hypothetical protein
MASLWIGCGARVQIGATRLRRHESKPVGRGAGIRPGGMFYAEGNPLETRDQKSFDLPLGVA